MKGLVQFHFNGVSNARLSASSLKLVFFFISLSSILACRLAIQEIEQPVPRLPSPTATQIVTRTFTPTATNTPTITPLPSATSTPTLTPTPELLVSENTPLPVILSAITLENAYRLSALAEWREPSVADLEWTPDGQILAIANANKINLYEIETRQVLRTLYPVNANIIDIAFSPGGLWLVAGCRRGDEKTGYGSSLDLWVGPNWKPLGLLYGVVGGLNSIAFTAAGDYLAVAYASPSFYTQNYIDFWQTSSWLINTSMDTGVVLDVAFSQDGKWFAASPNRYALQVWDLEERELVYDLLTSFTGAVNTFAFSPDGSVIAAGQYDGIVRIWDLETGELVLEFDTGAVVQSLAFSSDGGMIATGGSFENSAIQLWSSTTGEALRQVQNPSNGITNLLFSPDGRYLVSASYDGLIRLWGIRP